MADGDWLFKDVELKASGTCTLSDVLRQAQAAVPAAGAGSDARPGGSGELLRRLRELPGKGPAQHAEHVDQFIDAVFDNLGEVDDCVFREAARALAPPYRAGSEPHGGGGPGEVDRGGEKPQAAGQVRSTTVTGSMARSDCSSSSSSTSDGDSGALVDAGGEDEAVEADWDAEFDQSDMARGTSKVAADRHEPAAPTAGTDDEFAFDAPAAQPAELPEEQRCLLRQLRSRISDCGPQVTTDARGNVRQPGPNAGSPGTVPQTSSGAVQGAPAKAAEGGQFFGSVGGLQFSFSSALPRPAAPIQGERAEALRRELDELSAVMRKPQPRAAAAPRQQRAVPQPPFDVSEEEAASIEAQVAELLGQQAA
ncbi:hypothetical protein DIPPA_04065 [Diplonema papillatum]|nr:hypothetical protein DIPPA_04065 [Diplonema papillatum]